MNDVRWSRRAALRVAAGSAFAAALGLSTAAKAAPTTRSKDELPLPDGYLRQGPLGFGPAPLVRAPGVRPIGMRIDRAQVDAQIEIAQIIDGVMQNPTGPWVVSWYEATAAPGEFGNSVYAGHVDYYTVGPAVFWNLRDLVEGDEIVVNGEDGVAFRYAVTWAQNFLVGDLTPEIVGEIVGQTKRESITLITCGGEFDYSTGEYLERYVVRGEREPE